jgi:signal transduction histidine kinase
MKILNVDDKAENLYLIESLFQGFGHQVVSAANGEEALKHARSQAFNVVVTDLLMPRMDGFQLIRELRRLEAFSRVPIIVYTATYTDAKDEALALSFGADRFLIKPAEAEVLLRVVEDAVKTRLADSSRPAAPKPGEEAVELKAYNQRLIAKLEKKMMDLEQANHALAEDIRRREQAEQERNRLEEQLRQAQKLEAIGTLAGGIAHDFNNVLAGILCASELALLDPGCSPATRGCLEQILKASRRAGELVKQILTFSRQQRIDRRLLDLALIVDDAARFLRSTIPASIALDTELPANLPPVLADPTQIHQVVANLCTNAWHALAGKPDGRIRILLEDVKVSPQLAADHPELRPLNYVRLSVIDNGCGMNEATRAKIFDPFFTTKPPGVGTGLGLSVVHGILHSYDGAILLETAPGRGSTFQLYFPALDKPAPAAAAANGPRRQGSGQQVFLVDDEESLVKMGQRMLEHLGFSATGFTDPEAALEALKTRGADIVLVDLSMPKMDGMRFAKTALAQNPNLPVVLMTGFIATYNTEQVRAQGLRDLLIKPYNLDSLSRTVNSALEAGT